MSTNWKMLYAITKNPTATGEMPDSGANTEKNIGESSVHTEPEAKANAERIFDGIPAHPTRKRLVTAEAVRKGHPDKCCDKIADNILDEILRQDPNGRAAIEVIAAIAQEESRAVSENCKWRIRKNFERGLLPPFRMNGYEVKNGQLEIIPDEAEIVRLIFQLYLSGMGCAAISQTLNEMEIPAKNGGNWHAFTINDILHNEKYKGDLLLQKSFRIDHLTKKKVRNHGELQRYYVENAHEPIVDGETFERVQVEHSRRRAATPTSSMQPRKVYPFTGKVVCGNCGKHYKRRMNHGIACWQCSTYMELGKKHCPAKQIHEDILMKESALVLELERFDAQAFEERIREIRILPENRLCFIFTNGAETETQWSNPSRRDSWTSEMKEAARQRAIGQNI